MTATAITNKETRIRTIKTTKDRATMTSMEVTQTIKVLPTAKLAVMDTMMNRAFSQNQRILELRLTKPGATTMPMPIIHTSTKEDTTRARNMADSIKMSITMTNTTIKERRLLVSIHKEHQDVEEILRRTPKPSAISP